MATKAQTEQAEARADLLRNIKPGDTVYTVLQSRSKSGMYRTIDCYIVVDNVPLRISWDVARATGRRYDTKHEAVGVSGCGMDMGFALVYGLSIALFCPEKYDHDAAYALKHRWL